MSISSRNTILKLAAGLGFIFFCACLVLAGFVIGRRSLAGSTPTGTTVIQVENNPATAGGQTTEPTAATATDNGLPQPTETQPNVPATETAGQPTETTVNTPSQQTPIDLTAEDLQLLIRVWSIIRSEFDGELPSEEEVVYEAIIGSLGLLEDPHTSFLTPEVAQRFREQLDGSFEGIGAFVNLSEEGYLVIERPIEGQPADLAGLEAGDLVTAVNGESVLGKSLDEIIAEVKGPRGTSVTLSILREGQTESFDVTIVRDLIEIPIVEAEMLDGNIAYVHLTSFSSNAEQRLLEALEALMAQEPRAVILDLRDNPGGFLNQAVAVADVFLPEGVVLYQRDRNGVEEVFEADNGDIAETIPLVVLVNAGSASASEIVAGAIQDYGRGVLIGELTFGKGSVQTVHDLPDGSELRVTIARWYTPQERLIDQLGITPDIEVATPEEFGGEADTQLQRAIEYILTGN
ncbi:MAG: S41 family peptidase [Chloroflexi bacterium]|nr:S41 family peptidase [Chloroflexota bacterium]MCI0576068.1 S41 family peptidase [Chloroflexota bacterium]MCI0647856.1 S41 family peptidase [Chloroflexota bacterium]MCI0727107.1 S41 family peptidase [Chloroflexota bacterium]